MGIKRKATEARMTIKATMIEIIRFVLLLIILIMVLENRKIIKRFL